MKKLKLFAIIIATMTMFASCGNDDEPIVVKDITAANESQLTQTVYADATEGKSEVNFTTVAAWTSSIKVTSNTEDWISIDPDHGDAAGDYTFNITLSKNTTGIKRSATITIYCGNSTLDINVSQEATTSDGVVPEPDPLISEVQRLYDREYLPILKFTYDDNNRLVSVIKTEYRTDNNIRYSLDSQRKFVRGVDGKISKIEFLYRWNLGGTLGTWTEETEATVTYTGNNITKTSFIFDGKTEDRNYTWANGKITKITLENAKPDFNFKYNSSEDCILKQQLDTIKDDNYPLISQWDLNHVYVSDDTKNWITYIPVEYLMMALIENDDYLDITMSKNNIRSCIETNALTNIDKVSKAKVYESIKKYNKNYSYMYNAKRLPIACTISVVFETRYMDIENPNSSYNTKYPAETYSYKMIYKE